MNWKKIVWRQKIDSTTLPFEVCRLSEAILCPETNKEYILSRIDKQTTQLN